MSLSDNPAPRKTKKKSTTESSLVAMFFLGMGRVECSGSPCEKRIRHLCCLVIAFKRCIESDLVCQGQLRSLVTINSTDFHRHLFKLHDCRTVYLTIKMPQLRSSIKPESLTFKILLLSCTLCQMDHFSFFFKQLISLSKPTVPSLTLLNPSKLLWVGSHYSQKATLVKSLYLEKCCCSHTTCKLPFSLKHKVGVLAVSFPSRGIAWGDMTHSHFRLGI